MPDHLNDLTLAGCSIWLDDLSRSRLTSGSLATLIADKHVTGVTTNPSIFHAAITSGTDYHEQLHALAGAGTSADEALLAVITDDVRAACDLFRPVHDATDGVPAGPRRDRRRRRPGVRRGRPAPGP